LKVASFSSDSKEGVADGDVEAFGSLFTAQTLKDVASLDSLRLSRAPAPSVLIIGRDDLPGEGPLPAALRKLGVDVTHRGLPGYASMMLEPHEEQVPAETLSVIEDFFCDVHPIRPEQSPAVPAVPESAVLHMEGVSETPIYFGPGNKLFGILAEPVERRDSRTRRGRAAVILLDIATNYHVGPNRMYVEMARKLAPRGYTSLRFDFSGIGDSRTSDGYEMYSRRPIADVRASIDWLAPSRPRSRILASPDRS
jgi:hypothetical protein